MKLTTTKLKKIIKEELENIMKEGLSENLEYKKSLKDSLLTVDQVFEKFESGPQNAKFIKRYVDELALASMKEPEQYQSLVESEEWMQVALKLRGKFDGYLYSIDWKTGKVTGEDGEKTI